MISPRDQDEITSVWIELFQLMHQHFNFDELRTLCLVLNVDYEELGEGLRKSARIIRLIEFMVQANRLNNLLNTLNEERPFVKWPGDFQDDNLQDLQGILSSQRLPISEAFIRRSYLHEDWGEAITNVPVYGRDEEATILNEWIVENNHRLVLIHGLGGVGKTTLATSVAYQVKNNFENVYWRSLQHGQSFAHYLQNCIQFISGQEQISIPDGIESQLSLFITYLQRKKCLLVLDNFESILQAGSPGGVYRTDYEAYSKLLKLVAGSRHQSCLVITSRELPTNIRRLPKTQTRILHLQGVNVTAGKKIIDAQYGDLQGNDEEWSSLIRLYAGNPLALALVPDVIRTSFGSKINTFLQEGQSVFGDIYEIMNQQFQRLSKHEKEVIMWLAIERVPVNRYQLEENMGLRSPADKRSLIEALTSLHRRSLIEIRNSDHFTLPTVVLDFATDTLITQFIEAFTNKELTVWEQFALTKADSNSYIRSAQKRYILEPIIESLSAQLGHDGLVGTLEQFLLELQRSQADSSLPKSQGYATGNLINMLLAIQVDLTNRDFSELEIRQVDLQDVPLINVDFTGAHFSSTYFTDTFEGIISLAISPNNNILATGTSTGEIRLWQIKAPNGEKDQEQLGTDPSVNILPLKSLLGHSNMVYSLAFTSDGLLLASASEDHTIRLWDVESSDNLWVNNGHANQVYALACDPEGKFIASGGDDNMIQIWDIESGRSTLSLNGHEGWIRALAFSSDGQWLASGSDDQTVRLWETSDFKQVHILNGHEARIESVVFHLDAKILASSSADQRHHFWDVQTGNHIQLLPDTEDNAGTIVFSPEGKSFASCNDGQTIRFWKTETGECIDTIASKHQVNVFAISPDGRFLACGGEDQSVQLWQIYPAQLLSFVQGYSNWLKAISFSDTDHYFATCGDDKMVRIWDVARRNCIHSFTGHNGHIRSISIQPQGYILASAGDDHTIKLWQIANGHLLQTLKGHTNRVWDVSFSPDGKSLASASFDSTVRLWNVVDGRELQTFSGHQGSIRTVAFSPDGNFLASAGDDRSICIWDIETNQLLRRLEGHTDIIWEISFSPDSKLLASGSGDQMVNLWDVSTGELIRQLDGHEGEVWCVAFSPDGRTLASGSSDKTIRLWKFKQSFIRQLMDLFQESSNSLGGEKSIILKGHTNWVRALTFSPDGHVLGSCSHDGTIRLWELNTKNSNVIQNQRPYEGMNISRTSGLTPAQKQSLRALGAIENHEIHGPSTGNV